MLPALPVLAAWRRQDRDSSVVAGWRYQVGWRSVGGLPAAVLTGTWLVVVPAGAGPAVELAGVCAAVLQGHGARVVCVSWDTGVTDRVAAVGWLRTAVADFAVDGVAGVLSLVGLVQEPVVGCPLVAQGLAATVGLVQALGDAGINAPLWVATSAAVAVGPGEEEVVGSLVQAGLWGLGRVAALEYPQRWGGLVDLPVVLDERAGGRLCSVLAGCGEDQLAIRPAGVYARRLRRAPAPASVSVSGRGWVARGCVLVTGGTGGIGGHLAGWLATVGAGQVVLASRRGPGAAGAAVLAARVAGRGAAARVVVCDVTSRVAVTGLLAGIGAGPYPLRAVMHTAGVLDDGVIERMDPAQIGYGGGAKVAAAGMLDELTAGLDLDAFVLFSSAGRDVGQWWTGVRTRRRTRCWTRWPSSVGPGVCRRRRWRGGRGPAGGWWPDRLRITCGGADFLRWHPAWRWPRWVRPWPRGRPC